MADFCITICRKHAMPQEIHGTLSSDKSMEVAVEIINQDVYFLLTSREHKRTVIPHDNSVKSVDPSCSTLLFHNVEVPVLDW
eukprot:g40193.t1